jgi:hypothetical protein
LTAPTDYVLKGPDGRNQRYSVAGDTAGRGEAMSAICDGIEERRIRIAHCPKCKQRRRHTVLLRYDSAVYKCGKCGLVTVTE